MKTLVALLFPFFAGILLASPSDKEIVLEVKNNLRSARPGAIVSVPWKEVQSRLPSLDPAKVTLIEVGSRNEVACQLVDYDQNGIPDELVFQSDFRAGESKRFELQEGTGNLAVSPRTDCRFVEPREDVAWENDRIAFRMYGPPLAKEGSNNGIDVWTKRVRSLIIGKWYAGDQATPKISYHIDHGEGADYFNVGKSLGVGACALLEGDSLLQPGVFAKHRIIATGPLRAVFELTYNPVRYRGHTVTELLRVTLDAGTNLNKIDVTFLAENGKGPATFAAGIVKRKGTTTFRDPEHRWISLWGPTTEKQETGELGTAIVMSRKLAKKMKEDSVHALMIGQATLGTSFTYYAGAGWTRSGDFSDVKEWNVYLTTAARMVESPLVVRFIAERQKTTRPIH